MSRAEAHREARQRMAAVSQALRLLTVGALPRDSIPDIARLADRARSFLEVVGVE